MISKRRRGAALVETALVMPLLLMLTFGVMEYGWLFFRMHQVTSAARAGARSAILPDASTDQVTARVDTVMTAWGLGASGHSTVSDPLDITELEGGDLISITVQVPYANIDLLGISLFPLPNNLRASVSMAKEGP